MKKKKLLNEKKKENISNKQTAGGKTRSSMDNVTIINSSIEKKRHNKITPAHM